MGFNAPEWAFAFFGTMFANCVPTGIYATNTSEACKYQVNHCKAEILFVENESILLKFLGFVEEIENIKGIIVYLDDITKLRKKYPQI